MSNMPRTYTLNTGPIEDLERTKGKNAADALLNEPDDDEPKPAVRTLR